MAVIVCLLRGVNVGGSHAIRMDALRALCGPLGLQNPQTCLQSGNLIFRATERNLARLENRLEDAIERAAGFRPRVIARTAGSIRAVVANNPFASRTGIQPSKLLVLFLSGIPSREVAGKLLGIPAAPEEFRLVGREVYGYYPNGIGRSKVSPWLIEKTLQIQGTGRNWNTVTRLLSTAEQLEAGS